MKSLAEHLGAVDPRPETEQVVEDVAALADVSDPAEFCKLIVKSREFRQYLMNGITLGDLPSAVVCRVMDHAWGKPIERVEVDDKASRLENATPEQLEARALRLVEMARSIRLAPLTDDDTKTIH